MINESVKLSDSPIRDRYGNLFYWLTTYVPLSERDLGLGKIAGSLSQAACAEECASKGGIELYNSCAAVTMVASWISGSRGSRVFQCTKTICKCKFINTLPENKCVDGGQLVKIYTAGGATRDFSMPELVKPESIFISPEGCLDSSKPWILGWIQGINPGERWKRPCPIVRKGITPVGEPCYVELTMYDIGGRGQHGSLGLVANV